MRYQTKHSNGCTSTQFADDCECNAPGFKNQIPKQPLPYCYNNEAKQTHSQNVKRFYRTAQRSLPGFTFQVHFNKGGIAVWGETYAKISRITSAETISGSVGLAEFVETVAVVEAYDTPNGMLQGGCFCSR